jgi:hypothetical protein
MSLALRLLASLAADQPCVPSREARNDSISLLNPSSTRNSYRLVKLLNRYQDFNSQTLLVFFGYANNP